MHRLQDELAFSSSLLPSVQMTRLLAYAIQLAMLVDVLGTRKVSGGGDLVIRVALLQMAAKNASGPDQLATARCEGLWKKSSGSTDD